MEAQEIAVVKLIVTHGPDKHPIELKHTATVGELSQMLEDLTGVPISGQKIINRGKTLQNHDRTLEEAAVKHGSKLMLIGKKSNPEDDDNFKLTVAVEKRIGSLSSKQTAIVDEVTGVEKGYLQEDLQEESLSKLAKRLAACHEEYVSLLETLDTLELGGCKPAIRNKRKEVVKEIQKQLDSNDTINARIQRLQNKTGS